MIAVIETGTVILVVVVVVVEYPRDYDYDNERSLRPLFLVPALPDIG